MLQWYIRALADLFVNTKTYQHGISGAVARDTRVPSDCAKKCQQAFMASLLGKALGVKIFTKYINIAIYVRGSYCLYRLMRLSFCFLLIG